MRIAITALRLRLTATYERARHIEDRREFALAVKDSGLTGLLFQMRNRGLSASELIQSMRINQLERLI